MSELSPAAQAVLFAWDDVVGRRGDPTPTEQRALAAALQAAADQVEHKWRGLGHEACQEIRAIADELEAQ